MGPEIPDGVSKPAVGIHAYADNFKRLDRAQQLPSERVSISSHFALYWWLHRQQNGYQCGRI